MIQDFNEKRRFARVVFPCKISLCPPQQGQINSYTENISAGGVRVVVDQKLEVGSLVDAEMFFDKQPMKCKGRVVWLTARNNPVEAETNLFDAGIEFENMSDADRQRVIDFLSKLVAHKYDFEQD